MSIYTFDTKMNAIAWRHIVWRQTIAFIFVSNVWIDLYHSHVEFQYATYHGSWDIRQLSLFLGWPSYLYFNQIMIELINSRNVPDLFKDHFVKFILFFIFLLHLSA